jgi:hypothetical protein
MMCMAVHRLPREVSPRQLTGEGHRGRRDQWVLRGALGTVWAFSLGPVLKRLHLFPKLDVSR